MDGSAGITPFPPDNAGGEEPFAEVILVPGWGLGRSLWASVETELKRMSGARLRITTIELGKLVDVLLPVECRLAVGHSTGLLWLLHQRPFAWDGLVSVNGFTRFVAGPDFPHGVEARLLHRMLHRFDHDPAVVRAAFLERCGAPETSFPDQLPPDRLREGLLWLRDWDACPALAAEPAPLLVLAGRIDPIVPPAMTEACFGERREAEILWQPEGGHLLALTHAAWVTTHIRAFAQRTCGKTLSCCPPAMAALR